MSLGLLIIRNLLRRKKRALFTLLGLSIGVGSIVFFSALSAGLKAEIMQNVQKILPLRQLEVSLDYRSVGVYKVLKNEKKILDTQVLEKIKSIEGVLATSPQNTLLFPASLSASYAGQKFETDAGIFGIEREIIAEDIPPGESFADDSIVPIVLNTAFVNVANTILEANNLPMVNEESIMNGFVFDIHLNKSSFLNVSSSPEQKKIQGRVIGFSNKVELEGITIPLGSVERLNRELDQLINTNQAKKLNPSYKKAFVLVDKTENLNLVSEQINDLGFVSKNKVNNLNLILSGIFLSLIFLSGLIVSMSFMGVVNTLNMNLIERKKEIAIFRILGASRGKILKIFLGEILILGLISAGGGFLISYLAALGLDLIFVEKIKDLNLISDLSLDSFFKFSLGQIGGALLSGLILSILAGFVSILKALKIDPALLVNQVE